MEVWLHDISRILGMIIEVIAIAVITWGVLEAVIEILRLGVGSRVGHDARRAIWLNLARWLVAGLTFQLAADVISTSFAPTWDELGRLAVIAAIRTFLSFFLDREVEAMRERQHPGPESSKS